MRFVSRQKERFLQNQIIKYLNLRGYFVWAVRNGATWDGRLGVYRKNSSMKGISDIIGIGPNGKFIAVECKINGRLPTLEQKLFILAIHRMHGLSCVAYSLDDVIALIGDKSHLAP